MVHLNRKSIWFSKSTHDGTNKSAGNHIPSSASRNVAGLLKYMRAICVMAALCMVTSLANAQDCHTRVSLLTVSPGTELYSSFGHSALRIIDSVSGRDLVFNYGTFNFEEPGFYMKFVRGKLKYYVSVEEFDSFEYAAQVENRSITEQVLNIDCAEKTKLREYLQWNLMPENKFYKYDFTFDNCTTRLGDLAEIITEDSVTFREILPENISFRDAIHEYLERDEKGWSKLGIDILLGSRLDRKMTSEEAMFLPDNLMMAFDSATIGATPLVKDKDVIYKNKYVPHKHNNVTGPLFIFSCLFVLIAFLSFSNSKRMERFLAGLDGVLFFINGLIGVILLFMWFATDHYMTKDNYNLLWAWPVNIIAAFFVHSPRRWPRVYFIVFALAQILLLSLWFFLPQKLNIALIPLNGILIFRCFLYNPLNKRMNARNQFSK